MFLTIFLLISNCKSEGQTKASVSQQVTDGDRAELNKVYQKAEEIGSVNGLIIYQKNEKVAEAYFHGMEAGRPVNIKSASKSIISLLIGIALERGILESVHQPVADFFPEYLNKESDPRKLNITIEDLLTMRSGLKTTSYENYGPWVTSSNWVRFALHQPVTEKPGEGKMVYSTGNSHLLSVILTKASGMDTKAFAEKYLFDPMDIELIEWEQDPQGYYFGGNNMALLPEDMAKIGHMLLDRGMYKGKQIVTRKWLEQSLQPYTKSENNGYKYGYMWWREQIAGYEASFAWGWGGQYIFILPDLESVIVITSFRNIATQERLYKEPIFELVGDFIIGGLLEENKTSLGAAE